MSDLRFTCPACGQHVQCDLAHAGENIPCPSCAQLIRVPQSGAVVTAKPPAAEDPLATDEAKVSYRPAEEPGAAKVPTLEENFSDNSGAPKSDNPLTQREQEIAAARAAHSAQPVSYVKPRLSFILSGGQAPVPEENKAAARSEENKPSPPPKPDSEVKTFSE